jgi:hypothetical protein
MNIDQWHIHRQGRIINKISVNKLRFIKSARPLISTLGIGEILKDLVQLYDLSGGSTGVNVWVKAEQFKPG